MYLSSPFIVLQALKRQEYGPEISDKEELATARQLIHDGGYRRISTETAEKAKTFNIPCLVPARDGNMDFVKDVKLLDTNLPIYIKAGWDKMLDIQAPTGRLDDNGKDVYQDIAYPVTRQFRQELYEEIVKEFNAVMEKEGQQEEDANANEEIKMEKIV